MAWQGADGVRAEGVRRRGRSDAAPGDGTAPIGRPDGPGTAGSTGGGVGGP